MAIIVNMPRLSDTMEEGVVAKWLKKVGDKVEEGDILAEIETDKATMEFESFNEGTLLHIGVQEGETSPVDGMNPIKVAEAVDEAIQRARRGEGPTFLEMKTYRYRGHSMSDAQHYRTKDEVAEYKKIDPITQILDIIKDKKYATTEEIEKINQEVKDKVKECEKFADESPYPEVSQLHDVVYEQEDYPFIK